MEYECAKCDQICVRGQTVVCRWGMANTYECAVHGTYYIMTGPLSVKGDQIR